MDLFKLTRTTQLVLGTSITLLSLSTAQAKQEMATNIAVNQTQIIPSSPWNLEMGTRYWLGFGEYVKNLYGSTAESGMVSRLTYNDYVSNSAEGFWRLGHQNGLFVKGYFGGGSVTSGHLNDEDFPPVTQPYSSTNSDQKNGNINYFSADLGYDFIQQQPWRLGAFIGYHRWLEHYNAFGCEQVAGNAEICGASPMPYTVDILNNNAIWNSLRIGINGAVALSKQWSATADVAYIRSNLTAHDYHNLRPDIRDMLEDGSGNGVQLDALLNWSYTSNLSVGVGARWWHVATNGYSHFEQKPSPFGQAQKAIITHDSYGLLVQANYSFDDTPLMGASTQEHVTAAAPIYDWLGWYVGANLGYGTNLESANTTPYAAAPEDAALRSPHALNMQDAGFLGGGQVGYNWVKDRLVVGLEGDMDYAHISSANAITAFESPLTTSIAKNVQWVSSFRARFGRLASDNMLVYVTAGPAWGRANLLFAQNPEQSITNEEIYYTANKGVTKSGWTAGGGVEYALTTRLAFKAEYLYLGLGTVSTNFFGSVPTTPYYQVSSKFDSNILRLGINYKV